MAYASWSVVFGEQPSAAKWNILGSNDASFNDGSGFAAGAIGATPAAIAAGIVVQSVATGYSAVATGTTVMPTDDTIPQNTEGDQYMTQSITPKSATNNLIVEAIWFGSFSLGSNDFTVALFQDSVANALAVTDGYVNINTQRVTIPLGHIMAAGTTSAITFKIRAGGPVAGTTTFNGYSGGRLFGTTPKSFIRVTEVKV